MSVLGVQLENLCINHWVFVLIILSRHPEIIKRQSAVMHYIHPFRTPVFAEPGRVNQMSEDNECLVQSCELLSDKVASTGLIYFVAFLLTMQSTCAAG